MNQESVSTLPKSNIALLVAIWHHLSRQRRLQFALLLLLMIMSAVAELISLGAVLPFLAVLTNPEQLWSSPAVRAAGAHLGMSTADELVIPAIWFFATAAFLSGLVRVANLWVNARLAALIGSDLSCEAYKRTLYQPYIVHVNQNSASVIAGTTSQVIRIVSALTSVLQLATSVFVALGLIVCLLLISAPIALSSAFLIGILYLFFSFISATNLRRNSKKIALASQCQIKALQEGLGGIRDVILDGTQASYLNVYRNADLPQRILQSDNQFITTYPRYAVETLGLIAIATLTATLYSRQSLGMSSIPLLGAFALGAQRLLPSVQVVYASWSGLRGCAADFQSLLQLLNQPLPLEASAQEPITFNDSISLDNVYFQYPGGSEPVLNGLSLTIRKGERIGILGNTGCGKSTTIDLLLGLLPPTNGRVIIDGHDLWAANQLSLQSSWRTAVAHVPQNIFLTDASIAENIAFGLPQQDIDMDRVIAAAQQAQISDYIESGEQMYNSSVGERGIKLSGGQRQRIGIARALYRNASVLVLDEATSALDNETESAVMQSLDCLSRDLTIVMIAHRLTTLSRCDRLIKIENGVAVDCGPPSSVL